MPYSVYAFLNKIWWVLMVLLVTIVGLYPSLYFLPPGQFGFLHSKSEAILSSSVWHAAFYIHIIGGGLALLIGWSQFSRKIRQRYLPLHRAIGKTYIVAVLASALAGIYIGFYADGGIVASLGFISLGLIWFSTTLAAYLYIRKGQVNNHEKMMIYSYAACFAAVTLRIWLPLLTILYHDPLKAYVIVAWYCWVPNMVVAFFVVKRVKRIREQ
jgi:uncharacterized membrane protein